MASYYARKSTSLRAAKRWFIDEMDTMETFATMRRMRPIDTMASKQKLHVLGEFFPSVAMDVRREVLVTANYREDVAAAMLGDLTREPVAAAARTQDPTELLFVDLHADEDAASDLADEEDWSEVAAVNNGTDAWVVIQDDWEVVDKNGEKVRTFADVLQMAPVTTPSVAATSPKKLQPALLSRLSIVEHTATRKTLKKTESDLALPAYELERGVKSFGARKRHMAKHHR
ncbi:hypothetical protein DD238_001491 [Peronospora effusa]|uniref:CUE domain-containing protein n=1 Tax=Peronospora effusa TaxID=542832 RepID=A0A3M6VNU9_9STRA|nr:hypothetical protein DD238_001491 [Peronospora effusa]